MKKRVININEEEFITKANEYEKTNKTKIEKIEQALKKRKEFIKLYPFLNRPEDIDLLTADKIYNPGDKQTFFY